MKTHSCKPGSRYPFGARPDAGGVNFSVFSRHATQVELLLYDSVTSGEPFQVVKLDPEVHCTFFTWHVYVEGLTPGTCYNWRIDGPGDDTAHTGFRFDAHKALVDPWVRAVCDRRWDRRRAEQPGANHDTAIRGIVVDETYDWEGDQPLRRPFSRTVIYEMHVAGFTRNPNSGLPPERRGTYAGVIDKLARFLDPIGGGDLDGEDRAQHPDDARRRLDAHPLRMLARVDPTHQPSLVELHLEVR